ncbi:acyl-CoA N-acyltransferases (NAT) superfamily protein [Artemisia annua]|uniref:Acyl-CoA N-acyltransferases (NAT) superfamily protein n=1 Tax=Artemisia annua TaxID=35608 RepID=A0A2U1LIE3_ARTAN|nr:acyl-CoA N-acyltransferases (NAT) superfamily protein [Artemisia annua]
MADNNKSISPTELNRKSNKWAKIVDEIIRIEKKIFPKHESLARSFDDELKKKNSGLIYFEVDGDVGGYVMYSCPSSLCAVITKLAVKEQYRRQGHGEALVKAAIEKCRSKRINRVSLHVDPLRTSAMQLYKKLGFQIDTLAIQEKLMTQDKVMKWSPEIVAVCPLCRKANDTHDHLFLECKYAVPSYNFQGSFKGQLDMADQNDFDHKKVTTESCLSSKELKVAADRGSFE